jgi:hypothetical protein
MPKTEKRAQNTEALTRCCVSCAGSRQLRDTNGQCRCVYADVLGSQRRVASVHTSHQEAAGAAHQEVLMSRIRGRRLARKPGICRRQVSSVKAGRPPGRTHRQAASLRACAHGSACATFLATPGRLRRHRQGSERPSPQTRPTSLHPRSDYRQTQSRVCIHCFHDRLILLSYLLFACLFSLHRH